MDLDYCRRLYLAFNMLNRTIETYYICWGRPLFSYFSRAVEVGNTTGGNDKKCESYVKCTSTNWIINYIHYNLKIMLHDTDYVARLIYNCCHKLQPISRRKDPAASPRPIPNSKKALERLRNDNCVSPACDCKFLQIISAVIDGVFLRLQ